jgi:hypothetical protein
MIKELLKLTYQREVELEKKIERCLDPRRRNWLIELKNTNIKLQIKCLEEIDKERKIASHYNSLH